MGLKRRVSGKGTLAVRREAEREFNIKNNPAWVNFMFTQRSKRR